MLALNPAAQTVTFEYKDYADEARKKPITLALAEFIRRFRLHLLPARFVKIRHYGLLTNRHRHARVAQARAALNALSTKIPATPAHVETSSAEREIFCPHCQEPGLRLLRVTHAHSGREQPNFADSS